MTGLLIPDARIDDLLANVAELDQIEGARLVAVSAARFTDPKGVDYANATAAIETLESSGSAGVPHIVMLDTASHEDVAPGLAKAGGIIVPVDGQTEGGLARPYITAARLIDRVSPHVVMAKVEIAKDLFARTDNVGKLVDASTTLDVITGVRGTSTLNSMPPYLRLTEAILATAIRDLTGTYDAASGVLVLNQRGREVFYRTTDTAWQYLIKTPLSARLASLRVGEVEVDFDYHPLVVAEESGNPKFDAKRRDQLGLMLDGAIEAAGGEGSLNASQRQTVASARSALAALTQLAGVGQN
jgi:hypothetical protein